MIKISGRTTHRWRTDHMLPDFATQKNFARQQRTPAEQQLRIDASDKLQSRPEAENPMQNTQCRIPGQRRDAGDHQHLAHL
ncbi:MAG: hypothetical protein CMM01_05280 [Rhodopirellula sp.]|nr:hypothetical protein [Rhodopirellula sp.]MAI70307.1 hypothetical protein [Rhodopirellula sp.]